jgi:hypothetical protein
MTILLLPSILLIFNIILPTTSLQFYQSRIPNGKYCTYNNEPWPAVGHGTPTRGGSTNLNPFGKDFKRLGKQWSVELCQLDSDNDGLSNGEELGDPECKWISTMGDSTPMPFKSHPGISNSITNNNNSTTKSPTTQPDYILPPSNIPFPTWLIFHAVVMSLSIGFCLPISILVAIFRPSSSWILIHKFTLTCTLLLSILGGLVSLGVNGSARTTHGSLGVFLVFLLVLQVLGGWIRSYLDRGAWSCSHVFVGRFLFILSAIVLFTGYTELFNTYWIIGVDVWRYFHAVIFFIGLGCLGMWKKYRNYKNRRINYDDGGIINVEEPLSEGGESTTATTTATTSAGFVMNGVNFGAEIDVEERNNLHHFQQQRQQRQQHLNKSKSNDGYELPTIEGNKSETQTISMS